MSDHPEVLEDKVRNDMTDAGQEKVEALACLFVGLFFGGGGRS